MSSQRRSDRGAPKLCLSRRRLLRGGLSAGALALGLSGCDRFDASSWFSRGRYDVDRRFTESTQELAAPLPPALRDDERYSALVISDLHFYEREVNRAMIEVADYVRDQDIDFVFQLGDLADAGWYEEFENGFLSLEGLGVPIYSAIGNHDLWNDGWPRFRFHAGPSVYTLLVGAVRYVVLDVAGGTLGGLQRPWLEEQLAAETSAEHTVLLGHYPLWTTDDIGFSQMASEQEVYDVLDLMRTYGVRAHLSGHTHRWAYTEVNGSGLYTVSATKEESPDRCGLRLDVDGSELTFTRVAFPDFTAEEVG